MTTEDRRVVTRSIHEIQAATNARLGGEPLRGDIPYQVIDRTQPRGVGFRWPFRLDDHTRYHLRDCAYHLRLAGAALVAACRAAVGIRTSNGNCDLFYLANPHANVHGYRYIYSHTDDKHQHDDANPNGDGDKHIHVKPLAN